jgi:DNA end-binding protein Ku
MAPRANSKGFLKLAELTRHVSLCTAASGEFDPGTFADRYDAAPTDLVRSKLEGKPIESRKAPAPSNVVDLMEALRRSAAAAQGSASRRDMASTGADRAAAKRRAGGPKRKRPEAHRQPAAAARRRKAGS